MNRNINTIKRLNMSSYTIKNKESILDMDYNVIQSLGLNPENIIKHSNIGHKNINWKYGENNFEIFGLGYLENIDINAINNFMNKLESGYTYAITPLLVNLPNSNLGSSIISLSKQVLITKKVDSLSINAWLRGVIDVNLLNYDLNDLNNGVFVIKYRFISLNKDVHKYVSSPDFLKIENKKIINKPSLRLLNNNLYPITSKISDYGILINNNYNYNNLIGSLYQYKTDIRIFVKDVIINNNINRQCYVLKDNKLIIEYVDKINNNLNIFIRNIGKYNLTIDIKENKILNCEHTIISKKIGNDKRTFIKDVKIITFDIECYLNKDGLFVPYCCGFYDGKKEYTYYITDYDNKDMMFYNCINDMLNKYKNYTVYVHNLSGFDSYFLVNSLSKNGDYIIKPFFKDNKIFSLTILLANDLKKDIVFKDSYLLLNSSLRKLCADFKVDIKKGHFPYLFVNENNLKYLGSIPDYSFFIKDLKYNDYLDMKKNYISKVWSLKNESIDYLKRDLISLYQVLSLFRDEIFYAENVNITKVLTISSLTSKIFYTNYYDPLKNPIHIIKGKAHDDLRHGYYGGRVDVFKSMGKNIHIYDINSLYPYVMINNDMPIGNPIFSYDKDLNNYFGFVFCKITTPSFMDKPILPYRDVNGKLYNPLGSWSGMYFSEELKIAVKKYNYKVEVIYGYKFKKSNKLFNNFITKYYNLRLAAKNEGLLSKATTSKLLMNSLYGKYGMKPIKDITNIVTSNEANRIYMYHNVSDNYSISNNLEYIKYSVSVNDLLYKLEGMDSFLDYMLNMDSKTNNFNTSLPIAMAITAYARMYMNNFLTTNNYTVYSTDTDSIAIDKPLPDYLIGNNLGQFKLEYIAKEAIFLSPKLYYLEDNLGNTIIKARTLGGDTLNKDDFITMSYGLNINKRKKKFVSDMNNGGNVYLKDVNINLSPLNHKRQPHYDKNGQIDYTTPLYVHDGILNKVNLNIQTSIIPYKK